MQEICVLGRKATREILNPILCHRNNWTAEFFLSCIKKSRIFARMSFIKRYFGRWAGNRNGHPQRHRTQHLHARRPENRTQFTVRVIPFFFFLFLIN